MRALRRRYGHAAALQAVCKDTGEVVKPGTIVRDSRGEKWKFVSASRANEVGRDGKIVVCERKTRPLERPFNREFYARVFDMEVRPA